MNCSSPCTKRHTISKRLREKVWMKHNGNRVIGKCYCCNNTISCFDFESGHVVSVSNGGQNDLDNLQPICLTCNRGMSEMNLEVYKMKISPKVVKKKWRMLCC